jgi:hypothetical protein
MVRFEDYKDRFKYVRLEREDGVLEVTIHRDGGSALWEAGEGGIHEQLGDAAGAQSRPPLPAHRRRDRRGRGPAAGVVAEVVPKAELRDRAWAVARELAKKPQLMLRYTPLATTLELKRRILADLGHGRRSKVWPPCRRRSRPDVRKGARMNQAPPEL